MAAWWCSSMNWHHTVTYLSTVHRCCAHASPPFYPWLIVVVWWWSSMNWHHTLTYLSTVNRCHTHPSAPSYPSHNLLWQCDSGLAWTSTMHINWCHAHSSTVTQHSIHPYWLAPCTFINHDLAPHTSICTFLNTYNGPTWRGSLVSTHKSLLPWSQSTANGYIVESCPSDGTGILLIFTEQCADSTWTLLGLWSLKW